MFQNKFFKIFASPFALSSIKVMRTYRQILECIYLLQIIIELLKKKLSIVFAYTKHLKELFIQKSTQNLFN